MDFLKISYSIITQGHSLIGSNELDLELKNLKQTLKKIHKETYEDIANSHLKSAQQSILAAAYSKDQGIELRNAIAHLRDVFNIYEQLFDKSVPHYIYETIMDKIFNDPIKLSKRVIEGDKERQILIEKLIETALLISIFYSNLNETGNSYMWKVKAIEKNHKWIGFEYRRLGNSYSLSDTEKQDTFYEKNKQGFQARLDSLLNYEEKIFDIKGEWNIHFDIGTNIDRTIHGNLKIYKEGKRYKGSLEILDEGIYNFGGKIDYSTVRRTLKGFGILGPSGESVTYNYIWEKGQYRLKFKLLLDVSLNQNRISMTTYDYKVIDKYFSSSSIDYTGIIDDDYMKEKLVNRFINLEFKGHFVEKNLMLGETNSGFDKAKVRINRNKKQYI